MEELNWRYKLDHPYNPFDVDLVALRDAVKFILVELEQLKNAKAKPSRVKK